MVEKLLDLEDTARMLEAIALKIKNQADAPDIETILLGISLSSAADTLYGIVDDFLMDDAIWEEIESDQGFLFN